MEKLNFKMIGCALGAIALLNTAPTFACASFIADSENPRSGGSIKHFFSDSEETRKLLIKNETNEPCRVKLEVLDILPRLDGSYRYVGFIPNRPLYRSLSPYIEVLSGSDQDILWEEITLAPKEIYSARIGIREQQLSTGTHSTALKAFFPDYPAQLVLTEIYYSRDYQTPQLKLEGLSFDAKTQEINYTLKGKGESYSFIRFDLKFVDPSTGFEMSAVTTEQNEVYPMRAFIRNFWTPAANDERMIRSKFAIAGYNALFKKELSRRFPQTDGKEKSWVVYIQPKYGIDIRGWKHHHYMSLPGKTIEVKQSGSNRL